ncbi:UNVERIFIED_CONTAM: type II toxin-antitoxin system RelE/ParE family toxin [Comamonas sp. A-3]|nr:type II toxin-antitoxin system RelE/ParE family toxin [Comamonas thiooxydans]
MTYLIAYIAAGVLLGIASVIHGTSPPSSRAIRFLLIATLWPILALIAPDFLVDRSQDSRQPIKSDREEFVADLKTISEHDLAALTAEERARFERILLAGSTGLTLFADSADFPEVLKQFWDEEVPPEAYQALRLARWHLSHEFWINTGVFFSLKAPDWFVGFSTEFMKSISGVDKNTRARILEAIGKIANAPTTPHGDTIKPLTGDLTGLWRCRIGDDRLVYRPDNQSKKVVLLSFGARGGVYD